MFSSNLFEFKSTSSGAKSRFQVGIYWKNTLNAISFLKLIRFKFQNLKSRLWGRTKMRSPDAISASYVVVDLLAVIILFMLNGIHAASSWSTNVMDAPQLENFDTM